MEMIRTKLKDKKLWIGICVLCMMLSTIGILSYFTDIENKTNTFTVGKVDIELTEPNWDEEAVKGIMPLDSVPKDPTVKNIGTNDAYVFIEVEVPYAEVVVDDEEGNKCDLAETPLFTYAINDGWVQIGTEMKDEENKVIKYVYVYGTEQEATLFKVNDVSTLFNEITFANIVSGQGLENVDFNVNVTAKAIQSQDIANSTNPTDIYNIINSQNGEPPLKEEEPLKIVSWADGNDEEVKAMVKAADKGEINLTDYWKVGDTRKVTLTAMEASNGLSDTHAEQEIELVLMHAGGYKDVNGKEVNFVVGQKDCLNETGIIDLPVHTSWDTLGRRIWCNTTYYNSYPESLKPIFKQFQTVTGYYYDDSTKLITSTDYFSLPALKEVIGGHEATNPGYEETGGSSVIEWNNLFQFDYYKISTNRIKQANKKNSMYYTRSSMNGSDFSYCLVNTVGLPQYLGINNPMGIAPFGCI